MMLLVRNAETFAPEPLGRRDILCAGGTIVALEPRIDSSGLPGDPEIIDAAGAVVVPISQGALKPGDQSGSARYLTTAPTGTSALKVKIPAVTSFGVLAPI